MVMCSLSCARRVRPGDWLGPSGLCHTLGMLVNATQPGGLRCCVVASVGGGAPVLCVPRCPAPDLELPGNSLCFYRELSFILAPGSSQYCPCAAAVVLPTSHPVPCPIIIVRTSLS